MLKDINQLKTEIDSAVHTNGPRGKTTAEGLNSLLKSLAVELVTQQQEAAIASSHKADLDDDGRIPSSQLPVYVDDVLEAATVEALPETGEISKIYVVLSTNTMYRWSDSGYVALASGGGVQSVGGQTGIVTLDQLGLDKVSNTGDTDKPLSTATLAALAGKAEINDARLTGLDAFVNCQAVRISTNAARTRTFYGGYATDENPTAIDGVVQALRDATEGETVQITTPLVFPFGNKTAAVLLVPPNITLDLNGFSLTSTNRQDGIGFMANGNYTVYGGNATIYSRGSGSCGLTWPDTVTPSIRAYDLHLENTGSANCALVRSGSLYHRGSITVKSPIELKANGVYLAGNAAQYELVGDMTVYNNSTGFQVAAGCTALMRQGNIKLMNATAGVGIIYEGGKLELMQCVVDLAAGPTTTGVRLQTASSILVLTDVTVLGGSIVASTTSPGLLILRGSTTLPAAYEATYMRGLGITVTDERFVPGASGNIQAIAASCVCIATGSSENHPANQFATIAITKVLLDQKPSGTNGGFDAGTQEYTAPLSGIYQATSKLRIAGTAVMSNQSYGQGVGLLNEDGNWFLWSLATNSYINSLNQRLLHLNAGDKIRMYAYFDQFIAGYGAEVNIVLMSTDNNKG